LKPPAKSWRLLLLLVVECDSVSEVREYRLLPSALPEAERRIRQRYLVPHLGIIVGVIVLSAVLGTRNGNMHQIVGTAIFIGLFITLIVFRSSYRSRKALRELWSTYVLNIGPDYFLRQQSNSPDIRLLFRDVKKVEHLPGRYLRVVGNERYQVIGIPENIENFADILAIVSRIASPEKLNRDRSLKSSLWMLAGFAAYMVMLWSRSPWIVVPLAAGVSALLMWLFLFMQRSPNVLSRNKKISWLYLFLALLCLARILQVFGKL